MSKRSLYAFITGASRGIGLATAELFLSKGWHVISCSRTKTSKNSKFEPKYIKHFQADLSDPTELGNLITDVKKFLGKNPLHALINNAGISPKAPYQERLGCLNGDIEEWKKVFELNFYAPLKLSRSFASQLHKGSGGIVNVTSIAGHKIHPFAGSAYSISKAALSSLTKEMANEFADLNVRVNAVAPGEIYTEMIQPRYEELIPRIPLGRLGSPEDVAKSIYYLCSLDSGYVTGSELWVTGGQHMV
tara:strand:+ start:390 stop:1130 length:741 start_codon:yes stop_codon:yes gene_type:complete